MNQPFRIFLLYACFLLCQLSLSGQTISEETLLQAANRFMSEYFPEGARPVSIAEPWPSDKQPSLYIIRLEPEGWILMSASSEAEPVIGFSFKGRFEPPDPDKNNPAYHWINRAHIQIKESIEDQVMEEHPRWKELLTTEKSFEQTEEEVMVDPLIEVTWNQGQGYNRFCPEDPEGPGGHVYVGCVAVAMAQAMSVFRVPETGTGNKNYYHEDYGVQYADFGATTYYWDSMSVSSSDDYNALLLYHCAVATEMNFGPDGSGTQTSNTSAALKEYFYYSKDISYKRRSFFTDEKWKALINDQLLKGRPLIYSGDADDGEPGHAFNVDGVMYGRMFHINWGWGGQYDGYYVLDNLTPGTSHNYNENQAAVVGIQPYYYPTDIVLSEVTVELDQPPGTPVGVVEVIDEAKDNAYNLSLHCDSTLVFDAWIPDYTLDGDTLKTNRVFTEDDPETDTIQFSLTDLYNNYLEVEIVLGIGAPPQGPDFVPALDFVKNLVYPNPSSSYIFFRHDPAISVREVRIYDLAGRLVKTAGENAIRSGMDVSGFKTGMYLIELRNETGPIMISRFIKSR
ncbi:MAG TPA: T9SS type A sorting domain-containing protein [Bacteroidetes bacterium]|nr:T9SS type A sorting domain-containing protein [Bacteroidota bacterium]